MNDKQRRALILVVGAIIETVQEMGPDGAPAGLLFAALQGQGCTLNQFNSLMDGLVQAGRLRRNNNVYFYVPDGIL